MLTDKDHCDYETCVALSELGCPVPKYATINIHTKEKELKMWISLYNAQKWLREEKGKHIEINLQFLSEEKRWYWGFTIIHFDNPHLVTINGDYSSYEETLSEAIKEAVKILKEEDNDKK